MAALSNNTRSLCQKLSSDFDSVIGPAKAVKSLINSATNDLKSKLNTLGPPPLNLDSALDDFKDSVKDNLPGSELDDLKELKDFIDKCDYLKPLSPIAAVLGSVFGIFSEIEHLIDNLDLSIPGWGDAGKLGSLIDKILDGINIPGGDNITDLLKKAEELLNCIANACGPEFSGVYTSKSNDLTTLLGDLGVNSTPGDPNYGKFDYTKLYNDVGLSPSQITAIDKVKNGINGQKDLSSVAVDSTVSAFKNAIKKGLL